MSTVASDQQVEGLTDAPVSTDTAATPTPAAATTPPVQPAAAADDAAPDAGQLANISAAPAPSVALASGSDDASATTAAPSMEPVAAAQPAGQQPAGQIKPTMPVAGTTKALDDWQFTHNAFGISCGGATPLQFRYGAFVQCLMYNATAPTPADGETYFVLMDVASSV